MPSLRAVYEAKKELSDDELWAALSDCIKPKVTDAQKEAITKVVSELKAGEKGDFSMCTEDAVFLVPGAPAPMPVAMVAGMCGAMQAAMTWDNSTKFEIETAEILHVNTMIQYATSHHSVTPKTPFHPQRRHSPDHSQQRRHRHRS